MGCIYDDEYSRSSRRYAVMMVTQRLQLITTRGRLMIDDTGKWTGSAEHGSRQYLTDVSHRFFSSLTYQATTRFDLSSLWIAPFVTSHLRALDI